jgi:hypothetical protein
VTIGHREILYIAVPGTNVRRFTKIHEKVSGQFESVEYAKYFALIRTYLETCARNGINEYTALLRLTEDNPFSLSEVLSYSGSL